MNIKNLLIRCFVLLAVLSAPLYGVSAQEPGKEGDVIRIGENYILSEGETLDGSVIIVGGNVTIEKDAVVKGDIVVIGGNIETLGKAGGELVVIGGNISVSDEVDGSIAAIGGQIELTGTAVVEGDVVTVGGQLKKDPKAQVNGTVTNNAPAIGVPNPPDVPDAPNPPAIPDFEYKSDPLWNALTALFNATAVAAIAMLLSLFFQPQFERVSDTIVKQPFMAGSFGLLSMVVGVIAIVIMSITVILIPIAILAAFLFPLAWLFGMIALGQEVGERFTRAINQTWAAPLTIGFGTLLLMLVSGLFEMVPCVGWAVPALLALMGIGGVAMTWFGTRPAPNKPAQVVEVPPAS